MLLKTNLGAQEPNKKNGAILQVPWVVIIFSIDLIPQSFVPQVQCRLAALSELWTVSMAAQLKEASLALLNNKGLVHQVPQSTSLQ
jgi:hypothetical protein